MKVTARLFAALLLSVSIVGCGAQPMESGGETFTSVPDPGSADSVPDAEETGGETLDEAPETFEESGEPAEPAPPSATETPTDSPSSEPGGATLAAPPKSDSQSPAAATNSVFPRGNLGGNSTTIVRPPASDRERSDTERSDITEEPPSGASPVAGEGYVLEKVYYGTDRQPEIEASERWRDYSTAVTRFQVLLVAGLALCGIAFFVPARRYLVIIPAVVCLLAAAWFGRRTLLEQQQAQLDDANSNRRYGDTIHFVDGTHTLERGYCWVSVPTSVHEQGSGELESPGLFEVRADPQKHFTLRRVEAVSRDAFVADLKEAVQSSDRKHAFVFIHGYNVLFEEAALRTAQLKHDLDFDGPAALFSWPSRGSLLSYASDEETVNLTERSGVLQEFLTDFINETDAESIHLIAHSMGNRLLTRSFEDLPDKKNSQGQKMINQLIMAAPDVNPAEFRLLADRIRELTRARTLYASEKDIALIGSEALRMSNYTRLGQGGESRVIVEGVQTIDASGLDQAVFDLGHSYYVHPQVMQDLKHLLFTQEPVLARPWLLAVGDYWTFRAP